MQPGGVRASESSPTVGPSSSGPNPSRSGAVGATASTVKPKGAAVPSPAKGRKHGASSPEGLSSSYISKSVGTQTSGIPEQLAAFKHSVHDAIPDEAVICPYPKRKGTETMHIVLKNELDKSLTFGELKGAIMQNDSSIYDILWDFREWTEDELAARDATGDNEKNNHPPITSMQGYELSNTDFIDLTGLEDQDDDQDDDPRLHEDIDMPGPEETKVPPPALNTRLHKDTDMPGPEETKIPPSVPSALVPTKAVLSLPEHKSSSQLVMDKDDSDGLLTIDKYGRNRQRKATKEAFMSGALLGEEVG